MLIENYIDKEFVTIKTHYDLFKILDIFEGTNYDCLPVVENEKYIGLILEKDILPSCSTISSAVSTENR